MGIPSVISLLVVTGEYVGVRDVVASFVAVFTITFGLLAVAAATEEAQHYAQPQTKVRVPPTHPLRCHSLLPKLLMPSAAKI